MAKQVIIQKCNNPCCSYHWCYCASIVCNVFARKNFSMLSRRSLFLAKWERVLLLGRQVTCDFCHRSCERNRFYLLRALKTVKYALVLCEILVMTQTKATKLSCIFLYNCDNWHIEFVIIRNIHHENRKINKHPGFFAEFKGISVELMKSLTHEHY